MGSVLIDLEGIIIGRGIMITMEWFIPKAFLLWIVVECLSILIRSVKRKRISIINEVLTTIFVVYIICLIAVTIFPLYIIWSPKEVPQELKPTINLIPLVDIFTSLNSMGLKNFLIHYIGNFVLLSPLGFIVPMLFSKFRSIKKNIVLGFLVSTVIETLQYIQALITPLGSAKTSRASDINDIILNTFGVLLGYILYKAIYNYINKNKIIKNTKSITK